MQCSECGYDLVIGLRHKGVKRLLSLLPVQPYTCLRCGKRNWVAGDSAAPLTRTLGLVVLLAGIGAALWHSGYLPISGEEFTGTNSVRRNVQPMTATNATTVRMTPPGAESVHSASVNAAKESRQTEVPATRVAKAAPLHAPESAPIPSPNAVLKDARPKVAPGTTLAQRSASPAPSSAAAVPNPHTFTPDAAKPKPASPPAPAPESDTGPPATAGGAQPGTAPAPPVAAAPPTAPNTLPPDALPQNALPPEEPLETIPAPQVAEAAPPTRPAVATPVTFSTSPDALRLTLPTTHAPGDIRTFSLGGPSRFVIDVPGRWHYKGDTTTHVNTGGVKSVRTGVHADKLRMVIDLAKPLHRAPTISANGSGLHVTILQ